MEQDVREYAAAHNVLLEAAFIRVLDDYATIEQDAEQIKARVAVFAKHGAVKFAEAEDNRMKQVRNVILCVPSGSARSARSR